MSAKIKFLIVFLGIIQFGFTQNIHPNLILTKSGVNQIKKDWDKSALFKQTFNEVKADLDKNLNLVVDVPFPKDAGGGYSHEKHKQNYIHMHAAGFFYQITGEKKYAEFIKNMLDKYSDLYPTLKRHPEARGKTGGRLFWQTLNETVWLVHTIQAYDCIYDYLSESERDKFEQKIFIPMVDFFLTEHRHQFDLIHNHGTWMVAAVGMTGIVTGKKEYVDKALYGSYIDKKGGFLEQLDKLFSPDGYYTEGAYYVRYAMWPFFLFAEALENNLQELKIYKYRDSIIKKAFYTALQLTNTDGHFIPFNDALKEKNWLSNEIIVGLNFVYKRYGQDKTLLGIARAQNKVTLSDAGLLLSMDLQNENSIPEFQWNSLKLTDGFDGLKGGIGVLRFGDKKDMSTLLMKYTSHGLSHGHYDKLNLIYYDQNVEILPDYGAARFINIEQKYGGRYLPENNTFALQTVAHNTIVVDEESHFGGNINVSQNFHSEPYLFNAENVNFQYVSAKEKNAYSGVNLHRSVFMVNDSVLARPLIIDVYKVRSEKEHQYDLPFYYKGHFIGSNFEYKTFSSEKKVLGKNSGYQHLWKEAESSCNGNSIITWLNKNRFYSIISNADSNMQIIFTRIGGADPNFNLRNEPGIMFRKKANANTFVSVIESHGYFDPVTEITTNSYPLINKVNVIYDSDDYTAVELKGINTIQWLLIISNKNNDKKQIHKLVVNNNLYEWVGPVLLKK